MSTQQRLIIQGKVQGVGYRNWFAAQAKALALTGYVRNLADGSVEAVVIGQAESVDQLIERCWQGPQRAEVTAIQNKDIGMDEIQSYQGFQILR